MSGWKRNECEILNDTIFIGGSSKIRIVPTSEVMLLKTIVPYTLLRLHTLEEYLTSDTLESFENRLPFSFFRISRNLIINLEFVDFIQRKDSKYVIKLKKGEFHEVSRRRVKGVVEHFKVLKMK